jgi:hypothetical protein
MSSEPPPDRDPRDDPRYDPRYSAPGEQGYPPSSMSPPPYDPANAEQAARAQVNAPGIFLIVVGILGVLMSLVSIGMGAWFLLMSEEQFDEMMKPQKEMYGKLLGEKMAEEMYGNRTFLGGENVASGLLVFLSSLVTILGGVRMRQLRSYGLAMTGAILAAVPCTSGCCIGGQIAGVWTLIVLLNPAVRSMFR